MIRRAKSTNWLSILESVVIGVLGVFLITNPTWITQIIFYIIGIFLMVKGVYKIVNYFVVHGKSDFYNNDLLYGVIALIFGILIVILWEKLSDAIGIVVGAWMIYGTLERGYQASRCRGEELVLCTTAFAINACAWYLSNYLCRSWIYRSNRRYSDDYCGHCWGD